MTLSGHARNDPEWMQCVSQYRYPVVLAMTLSGHARNDPEWMRCVSQYRCFGASVFASLGTNRFSGHRRTKKAEGSIFGTLCFLSNPFQATIFIVESNKPDPPDNIFVTIVAVYSQFFTAAIHSSGFGIAFPCFFAYSIKSVLSEPMTGVYFFGSHCIILTKSFSLRKLQP